MNSKKVEQAILSLLIIACLLAFAGVMAGTSIWITFAIVSLAAYYVVQQIKKLGK